MSSVLFELSTNNKGGGRAASEKWRWESMKLEWGREDRARDGSGPGLGDQDTGLLRGFH